MSMPAPSPARGSSARPTIPTLIPPGYVGVVTNKASDPLTGADRGIQQEVLQPGIYFLNPEEKRMDIVSIGYSETSLTVVAQNRNGASGAGIIDSYGTGERPGRGPHGNVDARRSDLCRGQGHRVSVQRRLSDSPRLHRDLGHIARAGAQRRSPVRHAQGRRAQGDLASDRVHLPAARFPARSGRPAGGRHARASFKTRRRPSSSGS